MNTLYDRIFETTNTVGSVNPYLLLGALNGFKTFASRFSNSDKVHYLCTDDVDWEIGLGTINTSTTPPQISRDTVLASSQADAAVNWGAGTRNIFCDLPAALLQSLFDYPQKKGPLIRTADNTYKSASVFRQSTAFTTPALSNWGDSYVWTGGAATLALPAIAGLTAGWYIDIANEGSGTLTIDPNASETVEGTTTFSLTVNQNGRIEFDGTEFRMMFLSSPDIHQSTGVLIDTSRNISIDQAFLASYMRGHLAGLQMTRLSATVITVGAGAAVDAGNSALIKLTASLNKDLSGPWAAGNTSGLFSGSRVANTWYHVFVIFNPTTGVVDAGYDTNINASNKPAGFVARRIGSVRTDGSGFILDFVQVGDRFVWKSTISEFSGSAPTTQTTLTLAGVPSGVAVTALLGAKIAIGPAADVNYLAIFPVGSSTPDGHQMASVSTSSGAVSGYGQGDCITNTSAQVVYVALAGGQAGNIWTRGWIDDRGRFS